MSIHFFSEAIAFSLPDNLQVASWLQEIATREGYDVKGINYIFCDDAYLLALNQTHLNHDTLTDIITFDLSHQPKQLLADIYISIPRVKENAVKFAVSFHHELGRVLAHGLLHLTGYDDKAPEQRAIMRAKEEEALDLPAIAPFLHTA